MNSTITGVLVRSVALIVSVINRPGLDPVLICAAAKEFEVYIKGQAIIR